VDLIILENDHIRLGLRAEDGAITEFLHKPTGWQLIRQPLLARLWTLVAPVEGHRNNRIVSNWQSPPAVRRENGTHCILAWHGLTGSHSGVLDISLSLDIRLTGDEAYFALTLQNRSQSCIEEAWAPCFGGLREPKGETAFDSLSIDMCGGFGRVTMGDGFPQSCGYWGVDWPTFLKTYGTETVQFPFILLSNGRTGLYMGLHSAGQPVVSFVHELLPGYDDSKHSRVPRGDMLGGHPAGYAVSAAQLPFVQPEERAVLPPVVVRPFAGDWHEGLRSYRSWRDTWYTPRPGSVWARDTDCWITLHMNSPEGCVRCRYGDLPAFAREAQACGVQVIQIIGWALHGQDGAEPYQDTDPRLGTWQELKDAVSEIKAMGMRVLLMCKFKWMDASVGATEFLPHTAKDMHGNPVYFPGYAYQTLTQQLLGGSRRSGATLCHNSKACRARLLREFGKVLDLEPSGILYDELMNDRLLCFDRTHGHRWGGSNLEGALLLAEAFYGLARARDPEFLLAAESPTDALSQFYPVSYVRTEDGRWGDPIHRPALRYLDNRIRLATCLTGFDDREMVNQCLTFGYIINYEPFNFKGRMADIPDTAAYGRQALKLRRRLWPFLWQGRFTHTRGAEVLPEAPEVEFIYSVYTHAGKRAVVIANQSRDETLRARAALPEGGARFALYTPEREDIAESDGTISLPPRHLVVLVEQ
jgi:hypothetical protein